MSLPRFPSLALSARLPSLLAELLLPPPLLLLVADELPLVL
jgi:hypothetical protein